jgi:hypothetical protein
MGWQEKRYAKKRKITDTSALDFAARLSARRPRRAYWRLQAAYFYTFAAIDLPFQPYVPFLCSLSA